MTTHVFALFAAVALQSDELPRDPFWPQGYEGTRYPITLEPRVKPKPRAVAPTVARKNPTVASVRAQTDAEEKAKAAARAAEEEKLWSLARKSLHFGGTMGFNSANGTNAAIAINDRIYATGDFVSCNCGDLRFTWQIDAIAPDGKIKLRRVKHISLKGNQNK